jgi:EAL domain-containing protein (putative c-di-GMP-specific phosphodiesterase class I)
LREHGCDEGQGELLCAPLPAESLGAVLAAGRVSVEPEVS